MKLASWTGVAFSFTTGEVVPEAAVEVRYENGGGLAAIFEDEDGTTPIAQPGFEADANGMIHFYAAGSTDGLWIKVTMGAEERILRHQAVGNAAQLDVTDYIALFMLVEDEGEARTLLEVYSSAEVDAAIAAATPSASTSGEGLVELATQAEMNEGAAGKVPTTDLNRIALDTPSATASGTSVSYSIPPGVRRITMAFSGFSTNGVNEPLVQIGPSAGVETTGYLGAGATGATAKNETTGFAIHGANAAAHVLHGIGTLVLLDPSTNLWAWSFIGALSNTGAVVMAGGSKAIAGELENLSLIGNGDTLDAGSVNIAWER